MGFISPRSRANPCPGELKQAKKLSIYIANDMIYIAYDMIYVANDMIYKLQGHL